MNQLKVNQQETIVALYQKGWSKRRIARELGVDCLTVRRHVAVAQSKSPGNPQAGSEGEPSSNSPTDPHPGSANEPKPPATPHAGGLSLGGTGPDSLCEPWKECLETGLAAGLTVKRIHQDPVADHHFAGSYYSVRR